MTKLEIIEKCIKQIKGTAWAVWCITTLMYATMSIVAIIRERDTTDE